MTKALPKSTGTICIRSVMGGMLYYSEDGRLYKIDFAKKEEGVAESWHALLTPPMYRQPAALETFFETRVYGKIVNAK
jgi:hypothetical protein